MKYLMTPGLLVLSIILMGGASGCARERPTPTPQSSGNTNATPVPAPAIPDSSVVTLRHGQASALPHYPDDALQFVDVPEESRCPVGVQCAWEGDATVILAFLQAGTSDTTRLELHTNRRFASQGTYKDLTIRLDKLDPYPQKDMEIPVADYVATLTISRP